MGHPREARVELTLDRATFGALRELREDPKRLFLVSELEIVEGAETLAVISRASGEKCARCWTFDQDVGKSAAHPELCQRCEAAI